MAVTHQPLTQGEINRDIKKGTPFMITMSRSLPIRTIMSYRGYTNLVHRKGWKLLYRLMSHQRPWIPGQDLPPTPQQEAMNELDRLDNEYFAFARACIERRFTEQARYIFKNLRAVSGPEALLMVKAYVERLQALRDGTAPYREDTREADQEAVKLLEERYVAGEEIEARLLELVEQAMALPEIPNRDPQAMDEATYQELAYEFHIWLDDWRTTTRAAIKDRRYLIQLGLAKARRKKRPAPQMKTEAPAAGPESPAGPRSPGDHGGKGGAS